MNTDKADMIIAATSEVENNEVLARVTGEALREVARRGRAAWEELFLMLSSLDEKDEIIPFLSEFISREQESAEEEELEDEQDLEDEDEEE